MFTAVENYGKQNEKKKCLRKKQSSGKDLSCKQIVAFFITKNRRFEGFIWVNA